MLESSDKNFKAAIRTIFTRVIMNMLKTIEKIESFGKKIKSLSRETEAIQKNQIGITELKNNTTEINNSIDKLNNRMNGTEETISDL